MRTPLSNEKTSAAASAVSSPRDKPAVASKLQFGTRCLSNLKCDPTHDKNSGLAIFGLCQFGFGAVETDVGEIEPENFIGAIEPFFSIRNLFGKIFAHADVLRALSSEDECGFGHIFFYQSRAREQAVCMLDRRVTACSRTRLCFGD